MTIDFNDAPTQEEARSAKPPAQISDNQVPSTQFAGDPYAGYGAVASAGGTPFLKFDRGKFKYGLDDDELPLATRLVPNMSEVMIGWLKWSKGEVVDDAMIRLAEGYKPAAREDLGDTDASLWDTDDAGKALDPWTFTNTVPLKQPGPGAEFIFTTSSKGGISAVGKLCTAYGNGRLANEGKMPLVELGTSSYPHKRYGEVHVPVFRVVGWFDVTGGGDSGEVPERPKRADTEPELDDAIPF
jgi:hypothetical protein